MSPGRSGPDAEAPSPPSSTKTNPYTQEQAFMRPGYLRQHERRCWLLRRLQAADGPSYDDLVREVIEQFPEREKYWTSVRAVRSVRRLAFDGFITTESDESMWLTPTGWQAASRLAPVPEPAPPEAVAAR